MKKKSEDRVYKIAIIGCPKSGKTSLVSLLCGEKIVQGKYIQTTFIDFKTIKLNDKTIQIYDLSVDNPNSLAVSIAYANTADLIINIFR